MTVKELIEELKKLPEQEAKVLIREEDDGVISYIEPRIQRVTERAWDSPDTPEYIL